MREVGDLGDWEEGKKRGTGENMSREGYCLRLSMIIAAGAADDAVVAAAATTATAAAAAASGGGYHVAGGSTCAHEV